ncbi:calcium/sodium antiporter [Cellulosilyticum lentocellum]|uniref:Na+/Ca+ antiporter, CaCA family n=1 Tax=Cellulosilyticum lentocellum (strain ATCC 49066 / DSM 5427 / NCIMB 11756 / RHM5) TaxID=642492 RepID=F2JJ61_CELLD|nr:calcium/sodium antiporter [Cellulosilyticum lentocellum]ADZ84354.1 Na+/Ca+ antiporter, CaCA family [Cellulosilyticum lentocellum DSM 5427]
MIYVWLILGFILLIKGADYFVEGASDIAIRARIPNLIIGLTIVAFGTSAPEAAVSITSALKGQNDIAIGNVVGSNIFNLLIVVGIAAIITPLQVQKSIITKEFPFALLSSFILLILANDTIFQSTSLNTISRGDGLILLVLFGIYMYYLIEIALNHRNSTAEASITDNKGVEKEIRIGKSILIAIGGLVGIIVGGQLVVDAASQIALTWGMSEKLVGLTIVAVGTSLPELVTSIIAARKGKSDIALGNVIGSNIFNVFFILGISSVIFPIEVNGAVFMDMIVLLIVSIITYIFSITKVKISKLEGSLLVLSYLCYMVFIIIRN